MTTIFEVSSTQAGLRSLRRGLPATVFLLSVLIVQCRALAQSATESRVPAKESITSTDFFLMPGSDFVRPGLAPRVNLNLGIGHAFDALKKSPVGGELTFAYTYENAGSHGFWHTRYGSHTETLGVMRNFSIPGTTRLGAYTWIQGGVTSLTGGDAVRNRFYDGEALGGVLHLTGRQSIWIQESYNKVVTLPWYTSTGIGYVWSW